MKQNKKKKGFTIVELVIVIGIIGILTAVLVPTFINLTAKANNAADESLVKTLNTQLALKRVEEGKNVTMSGALADALEAGYKVENLTPKGNRDIVWNQDSDEFSLLEAVPDTDAYKYWTVAKSASDLTKGYSAYLYYQPEDALTVNVGLDVGEFDVDSVTYVKGTTAKTDVRFRTATGALTVNADTDTVSHWGYLDDLDVVAVYSESYHEYGKVAKKATLSAGHLVIEKGGEVPEVSIENSTAATKVTANEGTLITVDDASSDTASVVVNADGVFVEGVEESAISGSKASSAVTPTLITTEAELRAAANGFAKLGADITIETDEAIAITSKHVLDLNGHNITFADTMGGETCLYEIAKTSEMIVRGEGKITADSRMFYVEGSLLVEDGTFVTTAIVLNSYYGTGASGHSTIQTAEGSALTINGGNFYSAKCAVTNFGEMTINDGLFVSIATTTFNKTVDGVSKSGAHAYAVRVEGDATINGGEIYGVHGGLSLDNGDSIVNDVYSECSKKALELYASVAPTIHYLDDEASTKDVASVTNPSMFYALYVAGETGPVSTTIKGGEFVNKGTGTSNMAIFIGNSTYGDGGARLPASVKIEGGKFVSGTKCTVALKVNEYVGYSTISGGNFNKAKVNAGGATINLADATDLLEDGYKVVPEADGTYSVVAK